MANKSDHSLILVMASGFLIMKTLCRTWSQPRRMVRTLDAATLGSALCLPGTQVKKSICKLWCWVCQGRCKPFTSKYVPSLLISPQMAKRTLWWLDGSPSWTCQSWNSGDRKSCRFSTRARWKIWKVFSRSETRRPSSSWAGGRSTVTLLRLVSSPCGGAAPSVAAVLIMLVVLQLDDLVKVEGMTEKRFLSFQKASICVCFLLLIINKKNY